MVHAQGPAARTRPDSRTTTGPRRSPSEDAEFGWTEARELVLDAYGSFSPELADVARRFFDEAWIDAPVRPGKRPGAFCAYTVPSLHPYVLLNWTGRRRDVLTLAHELGHGLHAYLARGQGVFHQSTPLTLAETASVFGETVTFGRLLGETTDPDGAARAARREPRGPDRHGVPPDRDEPLRGPRPPDAARAGRAVSVDRFGEHWIDTQADMLGDAVELTHGYRTWWSYIPHFIGTPGYVYAYAYGQLLALSVYRQYEQQGAAFVPAYLELLARGGSAPARGARSDRRRRPRRPRVLDRWAHHRRGAADRRGGRGARLRSPRRGVDDRVAAGLGGRSGR